MTLFGLLSHYNKENAELYKKQKEEEKAKKAANAAKPAQKPAQPPVTAVPGGIPGQQTPAQRPPMGTPAQQQFTQPQVQPQVQPVPVQNSFNETTVLSPANGVLDGYDNEAASDVYGGMTNNFIYGYYTHPEGDGYWYDENGQATNYQALELWAEYYSACATGDEAALRSIEERFPEAKQFLDEMARSMVE